MNTKHTPGPWKVIKGNSVNSGRQYIVDAKDEDISSINHVDMSDGANARLIAAAPELLRELKSAIFFIETYGGEVTERFAAGGNLETVKSILKKAGGDL